MRTFAFVKKKTTIVEDKTPAFGNLHAIILFSKKTQPH